MTQNIHKPVLNNAFTWHSLIYSTLACPVTIHSLNKIFSFCLRPTKDYFRFHKSISINYECSYMNTRAWLTEMHNYPKLSRDLIYFMRENLKLMLSIQEFIGSKLSIKAERVAIIIFTYICLCSMPTNLNALCILRVPAKLLNYN